MKKIFVFLFLLLCISPANAAVDIKGINTMPYKPYDKEIKMEKIQSDFYEKNGIKIEKNVYKFEYAYKLGVPYEYVVTNNTEHDLFLKGVDSDYHANKNITRKSHWCRMSFRTFKYFANWQYWVPVYDFVSSAKIDKEKNPYWRDFPKNYTIKKGEKLRILAMGLNLDEIQKLTFIFEENAEEFKIEF